MRGVGRKTAQLGIVVLLVFIQLFGAVEWSNKTAYAMASGPGGVGGELLWLKADTGFTSSQWSDQSGNSMHATQAAPAQQPALLQDVLNFNPGVDFDTGDTLDGAVLGVNGNTEQTLFVVYEHTVNSSGDQPDLFDHSGLSGGTRLEAFDSQIRYRDASTTLDMTGQTITVPQIIAVHQQGTGTNQTSLSRNGAAGLTETIGPLVASQGYAIATDSLLDGIVNELIFYDSSLSSSDMEQVYSYLSLKYGIALDQATPRDLVFSDGESAWYSEDAGVFTHDVAGIARDDSSGLGQVKSRSSSGDGILTIEAEGEGTNASPSFVDMNDFAALTWGNNDGVASWTTTNAPDGYRVLERQWQAQQPDTVGATSVTFDIDASGFDVPDAPYAAEYFLIKGTSLASATPQPLVNVGGSEWQATGVQFNDGDMFTLAVRDMISVELTETSASDLEDNGGNIPQLLVQGADFSGFSGSLQLELNAIAGTATAGEDYALNTLITIPNADYTTQQSVAIPSLGILADSDFESTETATLQLQNPSDHVMFADVDTLDGLEDTHTYTITKDDTAVVGFSSVSRIIAENNGVTADIPVVLDKINYTNSPVTINYSVAGTATAGVDYQTLSGSVDIPIGSNVGYIHAEALGDALFEEQETVDLTITGTSNSDVSIGTIPTTILSIADNDAASVAVSASDASAAENPSDDGEFTFTMSLQNDSSSNVEVYYSVSGSASPGADYTALSGTAVIGPGNSSAVVPLSTSGLDDSLLEGDETVLVTIDSVNFGQQITTASATVTIADDDDSDGDGISNSAESVAPGGDGNGDSVQDAQQITVASVTNPVTTAHATLQASGDCSEVDQFSVADESSYATQDPGADYPVGLNEFNLVCPSAGQSATVTIFYDQVYNTSSWTFKKYDDSGSVYNVISGVTFGTANVNGTNVTTASYLVTDGGANDQDGVANGYIVDPAGPATGVVLGTDGLLSSTGHATSASVIAGAAIVLLTVIATVTRSKQYINSSYSDARKS